MNIGSIATVPTQRIAAPRGRSNHTTPIIANTAVHLAGACDCHTALGSSLRKASAA